MSPEQFQLNLRSFRVRQVSVVVRSSGSVVWVSCGPTLEDSGGEPIDQPFEDLTEAYAFIRLFGYRGTVSVDDGEEPG
jgi:hypothetical protein